MKKAFHKTFFLVILAIVTLIGGASYSTLVYQKPVNPIILIQSRMPASESPKESHKFVDVIETDCLKREFNSKALQVRIKGALCEGMIASELSQTVIENESTGDSVSVFNVNDKEFTTDFIHLEKGKNKISLKNSNKTYEFVVNR